LNVILAAHGQEAVDQVTQTAFQLILMDMQMPVMDGLEATRLIRQMPGGAHLPIVAMTANVFTEDKERCLAAGMNAHIAKPFTADNLFTTLRTWLPVKNPVDAVIAADSVMLQAPAATPPTTSSTALSPALHRVAGLDVTRGLKSVANRVGSYQRLLETFLQQHQNAPQDIRAALRRGQRNAAQRIAHSIKGSGGMIGAVDIAALAGTLESALRRSPGDQIDDGEKGEALVERLLTEFDSALGAFSRNLRQALDHATAPHMAAPCTLAGGAAVMTPCAEGAAPGKKQYKKSTQRSTQCSTAAIDSRLLRWRRAASPVDSNLRFHPCGNNENHGRHPHQPASDRLQSGFWPAL
jgi:CheY-like chemotaxis protein